MSKRKNETSPYESPAWVTLSVVASAYTRARSGSYSDPADKELVLFLLRKELDRAAVAWAAAQGGAK